jgi:hypothetical protein
MLIIDINKKYRTLDGRQIANLQYVPLNSCGNKVTYPFKGTIINKGRKHNIYCLWSETGSADVVWNSKPKLNLIEE